MKLLYSKKNIIVVENDITIKKMFNSESDFLTELNFYEQFNEFEYIPKLKKVEKMILHLEYIQGDNIYNCSKLPKFLLAKTLANFHNQTYNMNTNTAILHYDTNLNNYIFKDDRFYMFDFSDISIGNPISDVYSTLLFFCEHLDTKDFAFFYRDFIILYMQNISFSFIPNEDVFKEEVNRFERRREDSGKCIYNYDKFLVNKAAIENLKLPN